MSHPLPPADLPSRRLPLVSVSGPFYRIHGAAASPIHFGHTPRNRFDDPEREFGVLYVGEDEACAFIETFGWKTGVAAVTEAAVASRGLSRLEARHPLRVVDLTGPGLARLGADESLCSGDHATARKWSRALWAHPQKPDGLRYRARHDPSQTACAIYDRAKDVLRATRLGNLLSPPNDALLAKLLKRYRFGLIRGA